MVNFNTLYHEDEAFCSSPTLDSFIVIFVCGYINDQIFRSHFKIYLCLDI